MLESNNEETFAEGCERRARERPFILAEERRIRDATGEILFKRAYETRDALGDQLRTTIEAYLNERQIAVITRRYGIGGPIHTWTSIAAQFGIARTRPFGIVQQAVAKFVRWAPRWYALHHIPIPKHMRWRPAAYVGVPEETVYFRNYAVPQVFRKAYEGERDVSVQRAIEGALSPRMQAMMKHRYGIGGVRPMTYKKMAEEYEIDVYRIRGELLKGVRALAKAAPEIFLEEGFKIPEEGTTHLDRRFKLPTYR